MTKSMSGFTIVELATVIVAIGILAAVALIGYSGFQERARNSDRQADFKQLQTSLDLYKKENGSYPSCTGLGVPYTVGNPFETCTLPDADITAALQPAYITAVPSDPKNTGSYIYTYIAGQKVNEKTCVVSNNGTNNYVLRVTLESGASYCVGSAN